MEQAVERVTVCAYCRVSTKEDEQLDSYNNQIRFFEREFGERAGYALVEIYRDRGTSGTKLSRPGFDKMILDAGIANAILTVICIGLLTSRSLTAYW